MPPLSSEADIALPRPDRVVDTLIAYLAENDVAIERCGRQVRVDLGLGAGVFEASDDILKVRVEASDLGNLQTLRSYVGTNLFAIADLGEPSIAWRGNMRTGDLFANFREMRLKSAIDVAPRMRRLTFTGDVARFASNDDLHVRMYFPPDGETEPQWPRPAPDGGTLWPEESRRPAMRYYTVRRVDHTTGELDVDFVMHDDEGPGSAFAAKAEPGAICGMAGPLGRTASAAGYTLIAGDETAIPAIARMLETMPLSARGLAVIEADAACEIPLVAPAGVEVRWLHRAGSEAGTSDLLLDAVSSAKWPAGEDVFVWAACEVSAAKAIRAHLKTRALPRDRYLVVGYWQRGGDH